MRIISFATEDSAWKSPRMGIILNVDGRDSGDRLDCEKLFEPADRIFATLNADCVKTALDKPM